jgi:hypothetical protein
MLPAYVTKIMAQWHGKISLKVTVFLPTLHPAVEKNQKTGSAHRFKAPSIYRKNFTPPPMALPSAILRYSEDTCLA